MNRKLSIALLFAVLLAPSLARAHDPSKHKGKGTKGEIVSIAGDRIELKTPSGAQTVTIDDKTKFEKGREPAAKADLKKGDQVTVFGTKLATGELVAREVLPAPESHEEDKGGADHRN
jgi:hypothetical protein